MHFLRSLTLDSASKLARHFMPHQIAWIQAEAAIHKQRKQAVALAEKSVRIGWTYADAFKNVRKRIWFKERDYLFATKDYPSAIEYVRQCYKFAEVFNLTRSIVSHGEEYLQVNRPDEHGRPTSFTDDIKIGVIKFDNGSRIIAFSANPQAMSVYGGDVGLDEFAKHPNARLLWETAQARVTWNYDLAVWSSHDGEDTLFNEFAQEARTGSAGVPAGGSAGFQPAVSQASSLQTPPPATPQHSAGESSPSSSALSTLPRSDAPRSDAPRSDAPRSDAPRSDAARSDAPRSDAARSDAPRSDAPRSDAPRSTSPWNIYFRVTLLDAIHNGLVDRINRTRGTKISPAQFLADCRARARDEEIFEQSYMCNPMGAAASRIVEWSAIERCRADYQIERVHLEADDVRRHFGEFSPGSEQNREVQIAQFLRDGFPTLLNAPRSDAPRSTSHRLGFDVAASGQGDLACIYIDEAKGDELWLRGLFTCRTEDWHFLKTVLFYFLQHLRNLQAAGDESGLGRQICWEAAKQFSSRFLKVNFTAKKHDLGFALMNQLSVAEKRFPKSEGDVAADYFALRKTHNGTKWAFSEGKNSLNPASHCDIAWAGALATHAHTERRCTIGCAVAYETGWFDGKEFHPYTHKDSDAGPVMSEEERVRCMLLSDDPRIWRPL